MELDISLYIYFQDAVLSPVRNRIHGDEPQGSFLSFNF